MISDVTYDAIVIGGGLAGSCAAFHLARANHSVLVLEKESEPHQKVCGEFLSPEALSYLEEMNVDVDALGAFPITGVRLCAKKSESYVELNPQARGLSRLKLDEQCLKSAESAGAIVIRGVAAREFFRESERFVVKSSNEKYFARNIFLATGKHEMKKNLRREGADVKAIGFKMNYRLSEKGSRLLSSDVTLHFFKGGYAGLCRIEDGIANFCFMIEQNKFHDYGNHYENCLKTIISGNYALDKIFEDATPLWPKPLSVAPIPYGYVRLPNRKETAMKGVFCLGDQFAVIPSLSGSGMAIALFTGKRAADYFCKFGSAGVDAYETECSRVISKRMTMSYPFHHLCRSPWLANIVVSFLKPFPFLMRKLITSTRMPEAVL